ncbi:glycosyltransferase family 39 protein [Candidatus Omnitrophota bacterium]
MRKESIFILAWCLFLLIIIVAGSIQMPYFMDETNFLHNCLSFVTETTIVPVYARYPTLYSYVIFLPVWLVFLCFYFLKGLAASGLRDPAFLKFLFSENILLLCRASRATTMMFSIGTVFLILRRSVKKYGFLAASIAALLLCLDPLKIYLTLSRYGLPDISMTFLVTIAMLTCFRYLEKKNIKYLYWAALVSGLALSTKFNAIFMLFPLFTAVALDDIGKKKKYKHYLSVVLLVLAGFVAGTPALLISLKSYASGFAYETMVLFRWGHLGMHGTNWVWVVESLWRTSPIITILIALGIAYSGLRRTKEDLLFLALLLPSFLIMGALSKKSLWYFVFLYPLIALYVGRFLSDVFKKLEKPYLRKAFYAMLVLAFALPAWSLYSTLSRDILPDNRVVSQSWINKNIPPGSLIVTDWAYVPDICDKKNIARRTGEAEKTNSRYTEMIKNYYSKIPSYNVVTLQPLDYDFNRISKINTEYIVVSSSCYSRFFNGGKNAALKENDPLYGPFMKRLEFYDTLLNNKSPFRLIKIFSSGSGPTIKIFKARKPDSSS